MQELHGALRYDARTSTTPCTKHKAEYNTEFLFLDKNYPSTQETAIERR